MTSLVIGNTSQLSHYFPNDYEKISSRNIDFNFLKNNYWNNVYITAAEQQVNNKGINYIEPNYIYTMKIIESLLYTSEKIICYTSCQLWENLNNMEIAADTMPSFSLKNEYAISKLLLFNKIKELQELNPLYKKVIFIHPFYFNSVYRSDYWLFGKIFKSIINKEKVILNDGLDFNRDLVHSSFMVKKSIDIANNPIVKDTVVGSGNLTNVERFVKDLYERFDLDFNDFVKMPQYTNKKNTTWAKVNWNYSYQDLLNDTADDILQYKRLNEKNNCINDR